MLTYKQRSNESIWFAGTFFTFNPSLCLVCFRVVGAVTEDLTTWCEVHVPPLQSKAGKAGDCRVRPLYLLSLWSLFPGCGNNRNKGNKTYKRFPRAREAPGRGMVQPEVTVHGRWCRRRRAHGGLVVSRKAMWHKAS